MLPKKLAAMALEQQVEALLTQAPLLVDKISRHCDLGRGSPEQGLLEVLRFLSLLDPSRVLTPSERVDQVWHQFILWTRLYSDYCHQVYGRYLHHTPDDDRIGNASQFNHCLELYQARYGKPDQNFWGPCYSVVLEGACSGCES